MKIALGMDREGSLSPFQALVKRRLVSSIREQTFFDLYSTKSVRKVQNLKAALEVLYRKSTDFIITQYSFRPENTQSAV